MRIITGSAKGIKLIAPQGLGTRPTADRIKESLFNILGNIVIDAQVLDVFAGTGNLGFEALSRGAKSAVFIDSSSESIEIIKENARRTKLDDYCQICKNDVLRVLDRFSQAGQLFDLIFCDPPYNKGYIHAVLEKIDKHPILRPRGILVMEHSKHEKISDEWNTLEMKRVERYGETLISFLLYNMRREVE